MYVYFNISGHLERFMHPPPLPTCPVYGRLPGRLQILTIQVKGTVSLVLGNRLASLNEDSLVNSKGI
jgi:hypothetical protein